ncbi:MAG: hypothetical protein MSS69_07710 [Spirochaetales bacterium]|nr:hypothetical protein [Spirochaetales bacterium]
MLRYFNINGGDKEKLIEVISSYLGIEPEYQGTPTRGYIIGRYLVLYNGDLMNGEDDEKRVDALLCVLKEAGFSTEEDMERRISLL